MTAIKLQSKQHTTTRVVNADSKPAIRQTSSGYHANMAYIREVLSAKKNPANIYQTQHNPKLPSAPSMAEKLFGQGYTDFKSRITDLTKFTADFFQLSEDEKKNYVNENAGNHLKKILEQLPKTKNLSPLISFYSSVEPFLKDNPALVKTLDPLRKIMLLCSNLTLVTLIQEQNSRLDLNVGRAIYDRLNKGLQDKEFKSVFVGLHRLVDEPQYANAAQALLTHPFIFQTSRAFTSWPPSDEVVTRLLQTTYNLETDDDEAIGMVYGIYNAIAMFIPNQKLALEAKNNSLEIETNDFGRIAKKTWDSTSWWELALMGISVGGAVVRASTLGLGLMARVSVLSTTAGFRMVPTLAAGGLRLVSDVRVAVSFLAADTYMMAKQAPQMAKVSQNVAVNLGQGEYGNALRDTALVGSYALGLFGLGVGYNAFRTGLVKSYQSFSSAASDLLPAQAMRNAFVTGDTWRRLMEDPQFWIHYSRGAQFLTPTQKSLFILLGKSWDFLSIKASLGLGISNFALGIRDVTQSDSAGLFDVFQLMGNFAMEIIPTTGTLLYRAGRGSRNFNMGPALSQEEPHWSNPAHRRTLNTRLDAAIPEISKANSERYLEGAKNDLARIRQLLDAAEGTKPLRIRIRKKAALKIARLKPANSPVPKTLRRADWITHPNTLLDILAGFTIADMHALFKSGELTPLELFQVFTQNDAPSSPFARDIHRDKKLLQLARASTERYKEGKPLSIYDGLCIPTKDLMPDINGVMQVGSKSAYIEGIPQSNAVQDMLAVGALPIPVTMVAGANGGSGDNNGWSYLPNPKFNGYDPAGSSTGSAYFVSKKYARVAIGTDTGGSVLAPAGATDTVGAVFPRDIISRDNLVPFAQVLDRVGVLGNDPKEVLAFSKLLSGNHGAFEPASSPRQKPVIAYSELMLAKASPPAREDFKINLKQLREGGYQISKLSSEWDFIFEVPMLLYPYDAYPNAAYNHFNPHQTNKFGEAPRYTLDRNLNERFRRAKVYMDHGIFDEAMELNKRLIQIFRQKFGTDTPVLIASPAPEPILTHNILNGSAGDQLDRHDLSTMLKNRIDELGGLVTSSQQHEKRRGMLFSGHMPALLEIIESFF